ncbi:MAG: sugar ABC transporter ATP-binding protein [Solirubrobacteraceae bacterium]|nr:sugar ABC transporter ATP-binding protein [Solirubrobacteraceae bacterium]
MAHDIDIRGLTKSFGSHAVLHGIDLRIGEGEFVGLMGPNGAGKSTLIKILAGVHGNYGGELRFGGERVPSLAGRDDVGFIHQDLGLVDDMSIVDNLRLGEAPLRRLGPLLHHGREARAAADALALVGLERSVDTPVGALSPGEKTLVAVARLLARGARVLVVDEATSTLSPADAQQLIDSLKRTTAEGATVIMVSHKLSEILRVCDRIVVVLDGRLVEDRPAEGLDHDGLVELLVAHEVDGHPGGEREPARPGEELVRLEGAVAGRAGPVDLVVHAGEVVGLTGLAGSGLHDVAFLAHGSAVPDRGRVVRPPSATTALVPPYRERQGGFDEHSIARNLTISALPRWRAPWRLLRTGVERRDARDVVGRLDVRPGDPERAYGDLSGGNKQKVVFGRALLRDPRLYVLCEPTRGVDVQTRREIYRLIDELRSGGAGVLVVTSDFEDLVAVADRMSVVVDGRVGPFLVADDMSAKDLEAFI